MSSLRGGTTKQSQEARRSNLMMGVTKQEADCFTAFAMTVTRGRLLHCEEARRSNLMTVKSV